MKYTVYKITNLLNGKIYIGCHKTRNLSDKYMGSGNNIRIAVEKYGLSNFKKEYLAIFDNSDDMFNMESELVNEDFIKSRETYNILKGGLGSFDFINEEYWTEEKRRNHGMKYGGKAGSWERPPRKPKILRPLSLEEKQKIGKQMGDVYGGQNKLADVEINERLELIKNIDLTKYGWVKRVSEKLRISHTQTKRFIDLYYIGDIYRRNKK